MASRATSRKWPGAGWHTKSGFVLPIAVVLVVAAALLGACGGSGGELTTMHVPSAEVTTTTVAPTTTGLVITTSPLPPAQSTTTTSTTTPSTTTPSTTTTSTSTSTTSSTTTTAPTTTTTTTTVPPTTTTTTTTTTAPTNPTLRRGDRGDEVARLQQLLTDQRYWLGSVDGIFGVRTEHAVVAFQKVAGLERTGVVDTATWDAVESGVQPQPQSSAGRVLEVSLSKQVLLLVQDGTLKKVFDVSTGREGFRTPPGTHMIYDEVDGWHDSGWGSVWRPKYYYEPTALAFHGYENVPPYPASHGCVRLINPAIDWLWDYGNVPVGTTVLIY